MSFGEAYVNASDNTTQLGLQNKQMEMQHQIAERSLADQERRTQLLANADAREEDNHHRLNTARDQIITSQNTAKPGAQMWDYDPSQQSAATVAPLKIGDPAPTSQPSASAVPLKATAAPTLKINPGSSGAIPTPTAQAVPGAPTIQIPRPPPNVPTSTQFGAPPVPSTQPVAVPIPSSTGTVVPQPGQPPQNSQPFQGGS